MQIYSKMQTLLKLTVLPIFASFLFIQTAKADIIRDTIVSIKCQTGNEGVVREGTGILISEDGMVLTAKHVVLGTATQFISDITCEGAFGNSRLGRDTLEFQKASSDFDAVVLRYPAISGAKYLTYCNIDEQLPRSQIVATGFPRCPSFTRFWLPKGLQMILAHLDWSSTLKVACRQTG